MKTEQIIKKAKHKFRWIKDITPEDWERSKKFLVIESFKVNYQDSKCNHCNKIIKHKGLCWRYEDWITLTKNEVEICDKKYIDRKLTPKGCLDFCSFECALSYYEKMKKYSKVMGKLKTIHKKEQENVSNQLLNKLGLDFK